MTIILPFSYGVFYIKDKSRQLSMYDWDDDHVRQGFVRGEGFIAVATLIQWGDAHLDIDVVATDVSSLEHAERMIAVPFTVTSKSLILSSPDDPWGQSFEVPPGFYRAIIAQTVVSEERERIRITLERHESEILTSAVLVADAELDPPDPLVETAQLLP